MAHTAVTGSSRTMAPPISSLYSGAYFRQSWASARRTWAESSMHGTRGDDAGVARGEEPGLVVLLHEDGLHVHGDGNADARVALPVVGLLAAGGTGVDEEDVAVEYVREWRGIGVAVRVDGGDDAVLGIAQDFARLVFGDRAFGQLLHRMVHGGFFHGDGGAALLR